MSARVLYAIFISLILTGEAVSGPDDWYLWERVSPPPVTRIDWLAVAKEPGPAPIGEGWRLFDTRPYPSREAAYAAMSEVRTTPQFLDRCDLRWNLYKNVATNELTPFDGKQIGPIGPGYILEQVGLCCETAFQYAFGPGVYEQCGGIGPKDLPVATSRACRRTGTIQQPGKKDADGRILVEAATIQVVQCHGPKGPETLYVYQYLDRPGNRVIRPGEWGKAIGGKDFASFDEALATAATASTPTTTPPASGSISGEYRARDGRMCFVESGGGVTGYYDWSGGGVIEGSMQGLVLTGTWKDRVGKGQIRYEFAPDHASYEHFWKGDGAAQFVTAGRSVKVADRCSFAKPN